MRRAPGVLVVAGSLLLVVGRAGASSVDAVADPTPTGASSREDAPRRQKRPVRWIAIGGGAEPVSTEVSLEQDVALASQVLGEDGHVLFAGGGRSNCVRVLNPRSARFTLQRKVGEFLDPRAGRNSLYRRPRLAVNGPATRAESVAAIRAALREDRAPLLVYVATHGDLGETARDNALLLWGGTEMTVKELGKTLDRAEGKRAAQLVVTACYSGGFADVAFAAADAESGQPAPTARCGLFASQWDEQSSGCDPNPNRRNQEGYGIHFLNALRGRDRSGQPLPRADVDFDGDGSISLLEAHTRARIAARSIGVPTTTSERWLRRAAPAEGPRREVFLPEEAAVIAALSSSLNLPDEDAARARLRHLEKQMDETDRRMTELEEEEARRLARLRIAMLARWPVLDDPWHPLFAKTFESNRAAIQRFLNGAPIVAAHREISVELNRWESRFDVLRIRQSRVGRLVRAYETVDLASRLNAPGGPAWDYYQSLLACERGIFEVRAE